MADEKTVLIELKDNFYQDGFKRVLAIFALLLMAIAFLMFASIYLIVSKPPPQYFQVGEQWRTQPPVPINQAYLSESDVLQWSSDVLQKAFTLDFIDYQKELASYKKYFTSSGWKIYLRQLKNYVDRETVQKNMLFARATPTSAPIIINQGLLSGRYAWWVQMPLKITFDGVIAKPAETVKLQILVARVPTTENLEGVAIDNVIVVTGSTSGV